MMLKATYFIVVTDSVCASVLGRLTTWENFNPRKTVKKRKTLILSKPGQLEINEDHDRIAHGQTHPQVLVKYF